MVNAHLYLIPHKSYVLAGASKMFDQAKLENDLKFDEGDRRVRYRDTRGIWTIGIGHNLEVSPLPAGWTEPLTDAQIDALFDHDIAGTLVRLDQRLPWWRNAPEPVARSLANMGFNMGVGQPAALGRPASGLMQFTNTLELIRTGHYAAAADALDKSLWDKQVHGRADRIEALLRAA